MLKKMKRRQAMRGVEAAAEAIFPVNEFGAPDWRETSIVPRTRAYLDGLPAGKGPLIEWLFFALEWVFPLASGHLGRFSSYKVEEREALLRRWKTGDRELLNLVYQAIKATLAMMYLSHPLVIGHLRLVKPEGARWEAAGVPLQPSLLEVEQASTSWSRQSGSTTAQRAAQTEAT